MYLIKHNMYYITLLYLWCKRSIIWCIMLIFSYFHILISVNRFNYAKL